MARLARLVVPGLPSFAPYDATKTSSQQTRLLKVLKTSPTSKGLPSVLVTFTLALVLSGIAAKALASSGRPRAQQAQAA